MIFVIFVIFIFSYYLFSLYYRFWFSRVFVVDVSDMPLISMCLNFKWMHFKVSKIHFSNYLLVIIMRFVLCTWETSFLKKSMLILCYNSKTHIFRGEWVILAISLVSYINFNCNYLIYAIYSRVPFADERIKQINRNRVL